MSLVSAIAIYFIIWWVTLFAVLPFGVVAYSDEGAEPDADLPEGSPKSAPVRPMILRKMVITSLVALVVFAGVYAVIVGDFITLDDVPFLPEFDMVPNNQQS